MTVNERMQKFVRNRIERAMRKRHKSNKSVNWDVTNTLWWWLARNIQDQILLNLVCYKMACYLSKNNEEFDTAGITDIVVLDNTVFIYLKRPGIFIGKGGERIDSVTEEINTYYDYRTATKAKEHDFKISLIEDLRSGYARVIRSIGYIERY